MSGLGGAAFDDGEATIGKTRLLEELLSAADGGLRVVTGRAEELERDRPFGLFVESPAVGAVNWPGRGAGVAHSTTDEPVRHVV